MSTYPNNIFKTLDKKPHMTGILNTFLSLQEFTAQGLWARSRLYTHNSSQWIFAPLICPVYFFIQVNWGCHGAQLKAEHNPTEKRNWPFVNFSDPSCKFSLVLIIQILCEQRQWTTILFPIHLTTVCICKDHICLSTTTFQIKAYRGIISFTVAIPDLWVSQGFFFFTLFVVLL